MGLSKNCIQLEFFKICLRGHLAQLTRTAAVERSRCERRHRQLEEWVTRGAAGRHSERAPPQNTPRSTLARSKSLEILEDLVPDNGIPECKSLEELDVPDCEQVRFENNHRKFVIYCFCEIPFYISRAISTTASNLPFLLRLPGCSTILPSRLGREK